MNLLAAAEVMQVVLSVTYLPTVGSVLQSALDQIETLACCTVTVIMVVVVVPSGFLTVVVFSLLRQDLNQQNAHCVYHT